MNELASIQHIAQTVQIMDNPHSSYLKMNTSIALGNGISRGLVLFAH